MTLRAVLILATAAGFPAACTPPHVDLLIEDVTVIDPVSGAAPHRRVLVDNGIIVSVTPVTEEAPSSRERLNGAGRFLIPGLWDMHVHFLYEPALTDRMAGLFLDYGITSVRDTGGNLARMQALRERLASTSEAAPHLYFSGPLLDGRFVVYDGAEPGQPPLGTAVADMAAARRKVRELHAAGADFIKIYELVTPEVFEALAAEARSLGMPIAAHVPLMMTADQAGPLVGSMEHLRNIELACASGWQALLASRRDIIRDFTEGRGYELRRSLHILQRLPAIEAYDQTRCDTVLRSLRQTIQVPTLRLNTLALELPFRHPDWPRALAGLPRTVRNAWREQADRLQKASAVADPTFSDWSRFLVSRLKTSGVPIGAGTDTPIGLGIPGWSLHTELAQLVAAGLTPLEALYAATVRPASFLGLDAEVGRITPGMRADLLLLDADPLADIGNSRRISAVLLDGRRVR